MYATRSATCVFEITGPQTGMKGRFGFFDSPRPCVMIVVSALTVSDLPTTFSAGTNGETPPRPRLPWQAEHANCTKSCAPAAT